MHKAWREVERDSQRLVLIREGERLAAEARPDAVREASNAAKSAYCSTLHLPAIDSMYAAHDPVYGPTIAAITVHAAEVAAHERLPADLADEMSGPWRAAIASD